MIGIKPRAFGPRFVLAVLGMLSSLPAVESASAVRNDAGLYLYMGHPYLKNHEVPYATALSQSCIDGAAIMVQWGMIEPQAEIYDWSNLDEWVRKTVLLHKKLSIGVMAGLFTPDWLYGPGYGVPKNSFNYNRSSTGASCIVMNQPSVWNPVYLREYGKLMTALSRHLRDLPVAGRPAGAAYQALRFIKLSGINNTTEELRVDATKPDNGPCHQSDAAAIWAKAGFTPDKVVAAFMTIAAETAQAFPDKILSVDIIHRSAFPPIDNSGHVYAVSPGPVRTPDPLTEKILDAAIPVYRDRLLVQWDALWNGKPPQEVLTAGKRGARMGWQMNGFMGEWGGSGYIYPGWKIGVCKTSADFQSILDNGINRGGFYIEVQFANVDNPSLGPAFQEAHDRLWSSTAQGRP